MKVRRRSKIVSMSVGLLALVTGTVTIIGFVIKLQRRLKSISMNEELKELYFYCPRSPAVLVEELGCISLRFSDIKEETFIIGQAECRENSEKLYLEFIINTLDRISCPEDEAYRIEGDLMEREKERLRVLSCEIRYNLCENSRVMGAKDIKAYSDTSSVALRRLLGLDKEFPSEQDLEAEEAREMIKVIEAYWHKGLNDVECKISEKTLLLKRYVACVLARYLIECKIDNQKRMARDADVLMRIEVGDVLGDKRISPFVILSRKESMSPGTYMNVVREILFFIKYKGIISDMDSGANKSFNGTDELWFLLQKCKNSFNRTLSYKLSKLFDERSKNDLMAGNDDDYMAYRILIGFLGLTEGFQDAEIRQIKDQDMPVLRYYQSFLSTLVDDKAYYHILDTKKTIKVKDYMAGQLLRGYKGKIHKLASKIENRKISRMKISGGSIQMKHYLWILVRLIHDIGDVDRKTNRKFTDELSKLRENFILLVELILDGRRIDTSEPSTRAVLRLVGIGENIGVCTEGVGDEHAYIFESIGWCKSPGNSISSARCILNGVEVPLKRHAMGVVSQYLKECREWSEAQKRMDLKVFRSVSEAFSIRYEDGRPVGVEYFEIIRTMLVKVFCYESENLFRKAMIDGNSLSNMLKYYLDCKVRDVCEFFSKAFLTVINDLHEDGERVSGHTVTMIKRVLGKDESFMRSMDFQKVDERLFKSILSRFPGKYKKIECCFEDKEFRLVHLVALAIAKYLKAGPVENFELALELEKNLICKVGFYEER
ncbi:hypothetical protein EROM_040360 [Encephalitozoon romaleae SJ-2008]|uniref:Uncharacterized protein n=1 Tax=Encephalitozoon romaleae (strain SJ-2008) TaxID=1178016 RepID=I7ADX8_ENCRO|nr:hypothetical protein EROM_040360 [Encephalitozoon romaleae SJ-2008]AFN82805.1 hypothetical protein EROM_040360 [Encephalitozoon romaleae SJ-2008]